MDNQVEFKVYGKYALFTDPVTKIGGEKYSYQIPTYQALKGILESAYWKPTIVWIVDRLRIMKPIKTQTRSAKPLDYSGTVPNTLSIYTYLADVEYQVQAHFEWNYHRNDLAHDRNENKHYFVARRMIERGGRRDIFLGSRECQGYIEPCRFGEGPGCYDNYGELGFGLMFHGFDYPDDIGKNELHARFWQAVMKDGVVDFIKPDDCTIRKFIKPMRMQKVSSVGLDEEGLLEL
jgi:CRISPR-associated protein Cas5d